MNRMLKTSLLVMILIFSGAFLSHADIPVQAAAQESASSQTLIPGSLRDFQFLTSNSGWVLIENELHFTTNGGSTWKNITPNLTGDLRAVTFLNPSIGYTFWSSQGPDNYIQFKLASTQDGGQTWVTSNIVSYPITSPDYSVGAVYPFFLDSQTGWVTFKQMTSSNFSVGKLFSTTDGGKTWVARSIPIGEPVVFLDRETGFTAGGPAQNTLFRTTNNGLTWEAVNLPEMDDLRFTSVYVDHSSKLILPVFSDSENGTDFKVLSSSDQGETWLQSQSAGLSGEQNYFSPISYDGSNLLVQASDKIVRYSPPAGTFQTILQTPSQNLSKLQMVSDQVGWAIQSHWECTNPADATTCSTKTSLARTTSGGAAWESVQLPDVFAVMVASPALIEPDAAITLNPYTDYMSGQGFDMCEIASLSQLKTWKTSSPFNAVNLYMGGVSRACANINLSLDFVNSLSKQGWRFIPTWVGHQAACSSFNNPMSYNLSTAYNQGRDNAIDAARVAWKLGLKDEGAPGSVIYFDLEAFDINNTPCMEAAKAFINGWVEKLHEENIMAGVYGSVCASGLDKFYSIPNPPDVIWPALWTRDNYDSAITPDGLPCITNMWNHQRILQYTGAHIESWGGTSMYVDLDTIDGIVADISDKVGIPPQTLQNTSFEDGVLTPWQISPSSTSCSWTLSNNSDNARTGNYALLMNKTATQPDCFGVTQTLPLTPTVGDKYRFSVWVRTVNSTDLRSLRLSITGTGTTPETTSYKFSGIKDIWSCIEVDHTITQSGLTGVQVAVKLENEDGIDLYLDDAHLSLNTDKLCPNSMTPTNVEATYNIFPDTIVVNWDNVPQATYYKILRASSPTSTKTTAGIVETNQFVDKNLTPNQAFTYWVEACTPYSCGVDSNYVIGRTSSPFIDFSDDFESGQLINWIEFNNKAALAVCSGGGIIGNYGLCISTVPGEVKYAAQTLVAATNDIDISFWLDPNTANFDQLVILEGEESGTGLTHFQLFVRKVSSTYSVKAEIRDKNQNVTATKWYTIADAPNLIRFSWNSTRLQARAGSDFSPISLWVNNNLKETINSVDNYGKVLGKIQLGAVVPPSSGTSTNFIYIDEFTYEGPLFVRYSSP